MKKYNNTKTIIAVSNIPASNNGKTIRSKMLRAQNKHCLLYTSPSPRDPKTSRMPSSA